MRLLRTVLLLVTCAVVPATADDSPTLKEQLAKNKLTEIKFKKVELKDAYFDEAIDAFSALLQKNTREKLKIQWVYQGFDREEWKPTITLTGNNFSAAKVFQEILDQAGLKARLDKHAIVLIPKKAPK